MFVKKAFSFSSDCKTLEQSLKKVLSVVGPQATFFLGVYKKAVVVLGLSSDSFVMLSIPNSETAAQSGIFSFDHAVLPGLIKGRSVMEFKFNGSECLFKQVKGKYDGKIKTTDVTDDQLNQLEEKLTTKTKESSVISPETFAKIRLGISATGIHDVYQNTTLLSYVVIDAGRLVISSFDAQHFGMFRCKLDTTKESFRIALPQTHFGIVDQLANGSTLKLSLTNASLRAQGDEFIAVLPATQSDDRHFSMVTDFLKALPEPDMTASCELPKLLSVAENLFTLYNSNTNFEIKTRDGEMRIGLTTSSGSASDIVPIESEGKPVKLGVDPRLFMDILQLSKALTKASIQVTPKVLTIKGRVKGAEVQLVCSRVN